MKASQLTVEEIRVRRRAALRGTIAANERHRATRGGPNGHEEKYFWWTIVDACHREMKRMERAAQQRLMNQVREGV